MVLNDDPDQETIISDSKKALERLELVLEHLEKNKDKGKKKELKEDASN